MHRFERQAVGQFDACITVSENDRERLLELVPGTSVFVVPNGVDLDYFSPRPEIPKSKNLAFIGSMDYPANIDAVRWFTDQILPEIKNHAADLHFFIIGKNPPPDIQALNDDPQVTVTGFVEDVRPYLAESQVFVVPLRYGGGTRLKILDAWAMGKAVVSTSIGAEGLNATHNHNILLSDNPEPFARYILDLLTYPNKRKEIENNGRKSVKENYSWKHISEKLEEVYEIGNQLGIE